jgi:hypothetical protein
MTRKRATFGTIFIGMKKGFSNSGSSGKIRKLASAANLTASAPVQAAVTEPHTLAGAVFCSGTARDRRRFKRESKENGKATADLTAQSAGIAVSATSTKVPALEHVCHTVTISDTCFAMIKDETRAQHAQGKRCSEGQILEQALGYYFATIYLNTIITGGPVTHCSASYIAKMREVSASPC